MAKSMTTEPEDDGWLVEQLKAWPTRVHPDYTTNVGFLMKSAAARIEEITKELEEAAEAMALYGRLMETAKRELERHRTVGDLMPDGNAALARCVAQYRDGRLAHTPDCTELPRAEDYRKIPLQRERTSADVSEQAEFSPRANSL